jgi:hypothetical protein
VRALCEGRAARLLAEAARLYDAACLPYRRAALFWNDDFARGGRWMGQWLGHLRHQPPSQAGLLNRRVEVQVKAILLRHEGMLNELPEAIRQKIGFKTP